jgi:hypothetical protein
MKYGRLDSVMLDGAVIGKPVYALCTVNTKTNQLKASFYTMMVEGGPQPLWAVWKLDGKFQRFFIKRATVERAHAHLVWRRMSAKLTLTVPIVDQSHEDEMRDIVNHYQAMKTKKGKKADVVQLRA